MLEQGRSCRRATSEVKAPLFGHAGKRGSKRVPNICVSAMLHDCSFIVVFMDMGFYMNERERVRREKERGGSTQRVRHVFLNSTGIICSNIEQESREEYVLSTLLACEVLPDITVLLFFVAVEPRKKYYNLLLFYFSWFSVR